MVLMTISDARAGLAEVVDQVRISGEPVYLTRRNKPVAALVDLAYLDALRESKGIEVAVEDQSETEKAAAKKAEFDRRMAQMEELFAPIQGWFDHDMPYPESASDLYASREVDTGELA